MKIIIDSETSEVQIDQDIYHAISVDWDGQNDLCSQCAIDQRDNDYDTIRNIVCSFCESLEEASIFVNNETLVLTKEQIAEKLGVSPENLIITIKLKYGKYLCN